MHRFLLPAVLSLSVLLSPHVTAPAPSYTFTTIDVPGSTSTAVNANSPNAIAGQFNDSRGTHGFVLRHGEFTTINVPSAVFTAVNGISANGQLAGTYVDAAGVTRAFFWSNGVFTTLTPPGSETTRSQGGSLNAQGQVVGTYRDSAQKRRGFVWDKGV